MAALEGTNTFIVSDSNRTDNAALLDLDAMSVSQAHRDALMCW
jgi:hypothetical protein